MDETPHETPEPEQDAPQPAEAVAPEATPAPPQAEQTPAEEVVAAEPSAEQVIAEAEPAAEILAAEPTAEQVIAEEPSAEQVIAEAEAQEPAEGAPAAEAAPAPAEGAPAPAEGAPAPAEGAPAGEEGGAKRKRPRRRKGSKVAEQWGVSKTRAQGLATKAVDLTSPSTPAPKPLSRGGRSREPLPFDELRAAAQAITNMEGSRKALRDAFGELAPRERNDISQLVSDDADFRQRARSISAGSLAARKIGKALAAQQVAIASLEDVWAITLSKEEAAERLSRIRAAKNRDRDRARRNEERANRADRVSREDLKKAQDGRVGAQIRFVIAGEEKRDRKKKGEDKPAKKTTANDLLDRLGY